MTEAELLAEIRAECQRQGVACLHLRAPHREGDWVGWPDLLLIGSRAMCAREVKGAGTRLTAKQEEWLDRLEAAGLDADVWRERDLFDGSVRVEIARLNGVDLAREVWIPEGATAEEAAHRRALYG